MDAATIEQMNKVRASVGLPPLPVPGQDTSGPQFRKGGNDSDVDDEEEEDDLSTFDKRQAAASKNWQRLEDERLDRIERQKRKDTAKKARDAAQRYSKLEGKGLGEADEDDTLDTRSWLLQQKKRQKKIEKARKLEQELEERERQMQAEYTAKDLAGVKVGHELDEFDELTGERILTLKDAEIGDEREDDELENQDLKAQEKLQERLQLKKKRADYDPTDQDQSKAILSKYDEEIGGKRTKRFVLDKQGTSSDAQRRKLDAVSDSTSRGIKIDLDLLQDDTPVSDYLDAPAVKVKKSKKKRDKIARTKPADEDDILSAVKPTAESTAMDIDGGLLAAAKSSRKRGLDFDDDDLQAQLAAQRREALKQRKKLDAAELARQMREEMPVDEDDLEQGGLLIDETTEFVANLKKPELLENTQEADRSAQNKTRVRSEEEDEDEDDEDTEMTDRPYAALDDGSAEPIQESKQTEQPKTTATGLDDEEEMSGRGLGASVALLRKRGIIASDITNELTEKDRQRNKFLSEKQALIDEFDQRAKDQRETERKTGRWEKMSNRERDAYARQQNEAREQYLSRLQADMFNKQYKPNVKLEYYDEFGRSMNQKEAFKHLSHSFHGKTSGKQKTEKRLQRIENEKKDLAKGILSVSEEGGMLNVQDREGKRTKQAGVRLQ